MDIMLTTSIGLDNVIPPRCRTPRYAEVRLDVPCRIPELDGRQLQLAAEISHPRHDRPETTPLYHAPDFGFFEPTDLTPETIARSLAPPPAPRALPSDFVTGQARHELHTTRLAVQDEAERYLIAASGVYRRVPEPCYVIRYTPSFNYTSLDLEIRSVPEFSEDEFARRNHPDSRRPYGHFYSANDRSHADAAIAAIQAALPHSLSVDATSRIAVYIPDLFTFDATRWHTACDRSDVSHALTNLLGTLNDNRTREPALLPLYPERAALVQRITQALDTVLATL